MNKEDGYITKAEYIRRMQWNDDVLSVTDSIKSEMMGKMGEMVLDHFDADMSDLREYMHDKIKWEQKQWEAMPRWIPVTERKPFAEYGESDAVLTVDSLGEMRVACWDGGNWVLTNGNFIESTVKFPITHWMPLPEPPKEEDDDATK